MNTSLILVQMFDKASFKALPIGSNIFEKKFITVLNASLNQSIISFATFTTRSIKALNMLLTFSKNELISYPIMSKTFDQSPPARLKASVIHIIKPIMRVKKATIG